MIWAYNFTNKTVLRPLRPIVCLFRGRRRMWRENQTMISGFEPSNDTNVFHHILPNPSPHSLKTLRFFIFSSIEIVSHDFLHRIVNFSFFCFVLKFVHFTHIEKETFLIALNFNLVYQFSTLKLLSFYVILFHYVSIKWHKFFCFS